MFLESVKDFVADKPVSTAVIVAVLLATVLETWWTRRSSVWKSNIYHSVSSATLTQEHGQRVLKKKDGGAWFGLNVGRGVLPADTILIRDWHEKFWDRYSETVASAGHHVVINGTEGIGKSLGLNYILWKYITSPKALQKKR